jgi:predicted RNA-binding protein
MCLAKAHLTKDGGDELLLTDIAYLEISGKTVTLTSLLQETVTVEAGIKSIDFVKGSVLLEKCPS